MQDLRQPYVRLTLEFSVNKTYHKKQEFMFHQWITYG